MGVRLGAVRQNDASLCVRIQSSSWPFGGMYTCKRKAPYGPACWQAWYRESALDLERPELLSGADP